MTLFVFEKGHDLILTAAKKHMISKGRISWTFFVPDGNKEISFGVLEIESDCSIYIFVSHTEEKV